ncbi:hypothetical protein IWQ60_006967 [Tieghemiomyces parasiticus]|uniref:Glycine cleavage system H protein n=1 Tax=Tieghemiomyces parasiticus TaxID=78921 RepID=A0A9W8DS38_9FUNG|nr:hypothetical protein IWQ60_006967 [Tieghemiomyces parasiticus]
MLTARLLSRTFRTVRPTPLALKCSLQPTLAFRFYSSAGPVTKYTESHEWVRIEDKVATVGVTDYAQAHLGDVVFVELPEVNAAVTEGSPIAIVESVKAASDIYSPVDGTIVAANEELTSSPNLINDNPTDEGWMFKVSFDSADPFKKLMDAAAYKEFCSKE